MGEIGIVSPLTFYYKEEVCYGERSIGEFTALL